VDFSVTGTLVWYYCICKREVWLMAHRLIPDQDDTNIDLGRFINESTYTREKKEIDLGHAKIDLIRNENGEAVVGEVKKSSRFLESAKTQLLFYLLQLKEMGIEARGELLIPAEKKKVQVELDTNSEKEIKNIISEIESLVNDTNAPPPVKTKWCRNCAYSEFCWA
jgi:CRISPR-associated exonuclease Cas4